MSRALMTAAVWAAAAYGVPRPSDPFIRRAVMPEKARIVILALHENLSAAYDAQGAYLYQVWQGGVQDGNRTYTHQQGGNRGATYYPLGRIRHLMSPRGSIPETPVSAANDPRGGNLSFSPRNEAPVPAWSATQGGQAATVRSEWRGYDVDNVNLTAVLKYTVMVGTSRVLVSEAPEYAPVSGGTGLQRDFTFAGIPAGAAISLQLTGGGVTKVGGGAVAETWTATGAGRVETRAGKQYFVQDRDGQSRLLGEWR